MQYAIHEQEITLKGMSTRVNPLKEYSRLRSHYIALHYNCRIIVYHCWCTPRIPLFIQAGFCLYLTETEGAVVADILSRWRHWRDGGFSL